MQTKKDTQVQKEGGNVERADGDFDNFKGGNQFPTRTNNQAESSSGNMKKCIIGMIICGLLFLIIIIIVVVDKEAGRGKRRCPPYMFLDPDGVREGPPAELNGVAANDAQKGVNNEEAKENGEGRGDRGGRGRGPRQGRGRRWGRDDDSETDTEDETDEEGVCVRPSCDFRTEIMTGGIDDCEKCDDGEAVNGRGSRCVQDNCKQFQFLNQDGQCEECPDTYFKAAGKCYQADRAKIDLVQRFETQPDFAHYANVHRTTQNIAMFFDKKSENYKGPITQPFSATGVPSDSKFPLVEKLTSSTVGAKMFYFNRIQEEPQSPYYMDVWFTTTNVEPKILRSLNRLSNVKGTKCCWTNKDTGRSLSRLFTGFARIVEYADYQRNGASPEYAFKLTEGQLSNGMVKGFARVIDGFEGKVDFGMFTDSNRLQLDQGASDKSEKYYMDQVNKFINDNDFVVFTKSYCPYSRALLEMLNGHGLEGQYKVFEIDRELHGNEVHKALKEKSGRLTIPNVYLNKENLGGDEEVEAMAKNGVLKTKLEVLSIPNDL